MALEGGLRDRMILQSVTNAIVADLTSKGWLTSTGKQYEPIVIVDEFPDDDAEVAVNTISFSIGDTATSELELGSRSLLLFTPVFVDFFAENDGLGRHVRGDIFAYVQKVMQFDVYDYSQPVPAVEFVVQVQEQSLEMQKPERAVNPWQKHWYTVQFSVTDERPPSA